MAIETITIRKQTPAEGKWLYRYDEQSNTYTLTKCAYLGKEDMEWQECTETEKQEFDKHNADVQAEMEKQL